MVDIFAFSYCYLLFVYSGGVSGRGVHKKVRLGATSQMEPLPGWEVLVAQLVAGSLPLSRLLRGDALASAVVPASDSACSPSLNSEVMASRRVVASRSMSASTDSNRAFSSGWLRLEVMYPSTAFLRASETGIFSSAAPVW